MLSLGLKIYRAGGADRTGIGALAFYMGTKEREFKTMADSRDLKEQVQRLGERYILNRPKAGLAIGILQKGKQLRGWVWTRERRQYQSTRRTNGF